MTGLVPQITAMTNPGAPLKRRFTLVWDHLFMPWHRSSVRAYSFGPIVVAQRLTPAPFGYSPHLIPQPQGTEWILPI